MTVVLPYISHRADPGKGFQVSTVHPMTFARKLSPPQKSGVLTSVGYSISSNIRGSQKTKVSQHQRRTAKEGRHSVNIDIDSVDQIAARYGC
jgi:hypothetical protein